MHRGGARAERAPGLRGLRPGGRGAPSPGGGCLARRAGRPAVGMWALHGAVPCSAPPPPLRFFLFFDSGGNERGAGALQTRTLTAAHTRESSGHGRPCRPRARAAGERGRRLERRKEGEGASHRRRRQLREPRPRAVGGEPAAAAAPTRASGRICIPAAGHRGGRCRASGRPGDAARAGRGADSPGPSSQRAAGAAGAGAKAGMSRGRASSESAPSRGGGSRWGNGGRQAKPGSGVSSGSAARAPPSSSANARKWEREGCC